MINTMGTEFIPNCSEVTTIDESVNSRGIFYRLGESEIFEYTNKHAMVNGIPMVDVIPRMVVKDNGFTQIPLNMLDKNVVFELFDSARFKLNCKKAIQKLIDTGAIVMVYSKQYRIPTAIPYIAQTNGKKTTIFVNVTDFLEPNQYGIYEVQTVRNYNALMAALFAAACSYRIITMTSSLPADLCDGMVLMYANMFERVVNSMIHMDPIMREKVRYLSAEFALVQMYGTETGLRLFQRFRNSYFPKMSKMIMDMTDDQFHEDAFDKLSLFINELATLYPALKGLTTYLVYDKWIRSYGAATALSIDYIGYHLYTICMVLLESPLITRMALEPIMEKSKGSEMYKRLQAMVG